MDSLVAVEIMRGSSGRGDFFPNMILTIGEAGTCLHGKASTTFKGPDIAYLANYLPFSLFKKESSANHEKLVLSKGVPCLSHWEWGWG